MPTPPLFKNQEFKNWVTVTKGLLILRDGIEDIVQKHVHEFYVNSLEVKFGKLTCTQCTNDSLLPHNSSKCIFSRKNKNECFCQRDPNHRKMCPNNELCSNVYNTIVNEHKFMDPKFTNVSVGKWSGCEWEIAKAFINSPGYTNVETAKDTDVLGLISICLNAKFIRDKLKDPTKWEQARTNRNTTLHKFNLELTEADTHNHLEGMIELLKDASESQNLVDGTTIEAVKTAIETLEKLPYAQTCDKCSVVQARTSAIFAVQQKVQEIMDDPSSRQTKTEEQQKYLQLQNNHIEAIVAHEQAQSSHDVIKKTYSRRKKIKAELEDKPIVPELSTALRIMPTDDLEIPEYVEEQKQGRPVAPSQFEPTLKLHKLIDITDKETPDDRVPFISDLCFPYPNFLVCPDNTNATVKVVFIPKGSLVHRIQLPGRPWGVTGIFEGPLVAVTIPNKQVLLIVHFWFGEVIGSPIKMRGKCRDVAFVPQGNRLFVSYPGSSLSNECQCPRIEIMSLLRKGITKFDVTILSEIELSSHPWSIIATKDAIIMSQTDKVIKLSHKRVLLKQYNVGRPVRIAKTKDCPLLVYNKALKCISILNENLVEEMKRRIEEQNVSPWAMGYTSWETRRTLCLPEAGGNMLHLYKVE